MALYGTECWSTTGKHERHENEDVETFHDEMGKTLISKNIHEAQLRW